MSAEHYLGDGLYASLDDFGTVILRAPREDGDHWVALESDVLEAFQRWLTKLPLPHGQHSSAAPGGQSPAPATVPAGPAVSAGHSIMLRPTRERPRYLRVTKDSRFDWWWAHILGPDNEPIAFLSSWEHTPILVIRPSEAVLYFGSHVHIELTHEEAEQLRPLNVYGLVIEERPPRLCSADLGIPEGMTAEKAPQLHARAADSGPDSVVRNSEVGQS